MDEKCGSYLITYGRLITYRCLNTNDRYSISLRSIEDDIDGQYKDLDINQKYYVDSIIKKTNDRLITQGYLVG